MLRLYTLLCWLLTPLVIAWLFIRKGKGKEDAYRMRERFGGASLARPVGKLIWVHAASVGEAQSVIPFIREITRRFSDVQVLLTTGTVSSANYIQPLLPERCVHQFVPVDLPWAVHRFLKHWKPELAIWVESEFWPNLLRSARKRGAKLVLINARMSTRSYGRWMQFRGTALELLRCFSFLFASSLEDARKLKSLGAERVEFVGNLKYDAPALQADPKTTSQILAKIGDRPAWLAASTHPGEEKIIGRIHKHMMETFPELLTIIVPRHATRGEEVRQQLSSLKLTVSQRSRNQVILPETNVYIADTMGELGIFYRLSGIVLVGGSLVPHGGHNPLEPARLDCAILCGSYMDNFEAIAEELESEGGLIRVASPEVLEEKIALLLRDHELQDTIAKNAQRTVQDKGGVSAAILERIETLTAGFTPAPVEEAPPAPAKKAKSKTKPSKAGAA